MNTRAHKFIGIAAASQERKGDTKSWTFKEVNRKAKIVCLQGKISYFFKRATLIKKGSWRHRAHCRSRLERARPRLF